MALRNANESAKKLNRDVDRRKAAFFDLRPEGADSRTDRQEKSARQEEGDSPSDTAYRTDGAPGYADSYRSRAADPGRERHRVEVRAQEPDRKSGFSDARMDFAGAGTRKTEWKWDASGAAGIPDGRRNPDGGRRGKQDRKQIFFDAYGVSGDGPGDGPGDGKPSGGGGNKREIDVLPLYDEGGRPRRRIVRPNAPGSRRERPESRVQPKGIRVGSPYKEEGSPYREDGSPRGEDGYPYVEDGYPYREDGYPYGEDAYTYGEGGSPYREGRSPYREDGSRYTEDESFREPEEDFPEESTGPAENPGLRRRRRIMARQERERTLRRIYLSIGGAAVIAVLLLVFVISGLVRRSGKNAGEGITASAGAEDGSGGRGTEAGEDLPDAGEEGVPYVDAGAQEMSDQDVGAVQADAAGQGEGGLTAEAFPAAGGAPAELDESSGVGGAGLSGSGNQPDRTAASELPGYGEISDDIEGASEGGAIQTEADRGVPSPDAADGARDSEADPSTGAAEPSAEAAAYGLQDDWRFILVNQWNPLPEGYRVEVQALPNGESVDRRCYGELVRMLDDCRAGGGTPIVCSSYREHEKQVRLFNEQVDSLLAAGMDRAEAEEEAGTVVARPGTSEHELGLAVDICDTQYQQLDTAQEETATQKWLMEHCWEYGFILRYPNGKSEITGIIYEPWHYRYVGVEAAAEIRDSGLCLEEYLQGKA